MEPSSQERLEKASRWEEEARKQKGKDGAEKRLRIRKWG